MLSARAALRSLARRAPPPGTRGGRYSQEEVRRLLDPRSSVVEERRRAAVEAAGLPGSWLAYLREAESRRIGRLASRLPTIVYLYTSGASLEEIQGRLGGWSTWSAEQALEAACACIAERLNRGD